MSMSQICIYGLKTVISYKATIMKSKLIFLFFILGLLTFASAILDVREYGHDHDYDHDYDYNHDHDYDHDHDHYHERPSTLDALALRRDVPATEDIPSEVRSALAKHRLTVTLRDSDHVEDNSSSRHVFILKEGSFLGRAVGNITRLKRGSLPVSDTFRKAYRPPWQSGTFTPRITGSGQKMVIFRNGDTFVPTDNQAFLYNQYPARQPFYPGDYPWNCIGKLLIWTNIHNEGPDRWCTAALIWTRAVLTAGHCVPWDSGNNNWKAQFVAGYYDGKPSPGSGGQSWVTDAYGWNPHETVQAYDMAVLRLADPIGSWLGYFGSKSFSNSWVGGNYWYLVGYPFDVASAERPSSQSGIAVVDTDSSNGGKKLEHYGDIASGDSGGPFFAFWNNDPYVVGTTSGHEHESGFLGIGSEDDNVEAGGNDLNSLVSYARSNWPT